VALAVLELPVVEVLARLSWRPAAIAGISDTQGGPVAVGRPANLCVIDPDLRWSVAAGQTASRSRNIPYVGRTLQGKVRHTLCAGEPVVVDGDAQR
jgi:dihydroorotase